MHWVSAATVPTPVRLKIIEKSTSVTTGVWCLDDGLRGGSRIERQAICQFCEDSVSGTLAHSRQLVAKRRGALMPSTNVDYLRLVQELLALEDKNSLTNLEESERQQLVELSKALFGLPSILAEKRKHFRVQASLPAELVHALGNLAAILVPDRDRRVVEQAPVGLLALL